MLKLNRYPRKAGRLHRRHDRFRMPEILKVDSVSLREIFIIEPIMALLWTEIAHDKTPAVAARSQESRDQRRQGRIGSCGPSTGRSELTSSTGARISGPRRPTRHGCVGVGKYPVVLERAVALQPANHAQRLRAKCRAGHGRSWSDFPNDRAMPNHARYEW